MVPDITQQHVSEGAIPLDDWWTLPGSQDLDRVVRLALANNQSLASAQAHLAAARQRIAVARGPLYPQLDAIATAQRTRFGAPVLGPLAAGFPAFSAYAAGVQVSYDFDVFGGTRRLVENAVASARYESMRRDAAALSVSGNVVLEALQIASLRAQIRVVEQIIADDEHLLKLVRAEHDEGMVSKTDVLIALSQTDHDRTLLPPLRQGLIAARGALTILVGAAPVDWAPPEFDLATLTLPQDLPVALPSELVHRRPDILAAEAHPTGQHHPSPGPAQAPPLPEPPAGARVARGRAPRSRFRRCASRSAAGQYHFAELPVPTAALRSPGYGAARQSPGP